MFERFPSLTRFSQGWSISEKIDGTNAQVIVGTKCSDNAYVDQSIKFEGWDAPENPYLLFAGSRSRLITPSSDNHGFARYVEANAAMLIETLGEGRHFGEWWGQGIQRGYGMKEKRFSLFNTLRWKQEDLPQGLYVVPCMVDNVYLDNPGSAAEEVLNILKVAGSQCSPGFMDVEGIVMYHRASGTAFKKTYDYDEQGKWAENQAAKG